MNEQNVSSSQYIFMTIEYRVLGIEYEPVFKTMRILLKGFKY